MTKTYHFLIAVLGQTLIILSLSTHAFSQSMYKITYGDLDTNRISVEEFKNQKQLKSPNGIFIDSAFAYFSIPGHNAISVVEYLPKFDSVKFRKYSDILVPGATVIFNVFVTGKHHKSYPVQLSYMFYAMKRGNINFSSPLAVGNRTAIESRCCRLALTSATSASCSATGRSLVLNSSSGLQPQHTLAKQVYTN